MDKDVKYIGTSDGYKLEVEVDGVRGHTPLSNQFQAISEARWGYFGAPPIEASFAICCDALRREYRDSDLASSHAWMVHMAFCYLVLAELPANEDFVLTHKEVMETITFILLKTRYD